MAGIEPFTISDEKEMIVSLLDPCVKPEYVNVFNSDSPSYSTEFNYTIGNNDLPVYYGRFIFITEPIVHNFCGDLAVSKFYNDELIDFETRPGWDNLDDDATLFIESQDISLVNTKGFVKVRYYLVLYP